MTISRACLLARLALLVFDLALGPEAWLRKLSSV
jgi:hypothetical protein